MKLAPGSKHVLCGCSCQTAVSSRSAGSASRRQKPFSSHTSSMLTASGPPSCSSTRSSRGTSTSAVTCTSTSCCPAAPPCCLVCPVGWSERSSSSTSKGCSRETRKNSRSVVEFGVILVTWTIQVELLNFNPNGDTSCAVKHPDLLWFVPSPFSFQSFTTLLLPFFLHQHIYTVFSSFDKNPAVFHCRKNPLHTNDS